MRKVKGFVLGLGENEYEFSAKEARHIAKHFGLDRLERKVKHNRIGLICLAGFVYIATSFVYVDHETGNLKYDAEQTIGNWKKKLGLDSLIDKIDEELAHKVKKEDKNDEN